MVTEPFVSAARANARAEGMPDLALVVVPHDYLEEDDQRVRAKLETIVGDILERLYVLA